MQLLPITRKTPPLLLTFGAPLDGFCQGRDISWTPILWIIDIYIKTLHLSFLYSLVGYVTIRDHQENHSSTYDVPRLCTSLCDLRCYLYVHYLSIALLYLRVLLSLLVYMSLLSHGIWSWNYTFFSQWVFKALPSPTYVSLWLLVLIYVLFTCIS